MPDFRGKGSTLEVNRWSPLEPRDWGTGREACSEQNGAPEGSRFPERLALQAAVGRQPT